MTMVSTIDPSTLAFESIQTNSLLTFHTTYSLDSWRYKRAGNRRATQRTRFHRIGVWLKWRNLRFGIWVCELWSAVSGVLHSFLMTLRTQTHTRFVAVDGTNEGSWYKDLREEAAIVRTKGLLLRLLNPFVLVPWTRHVIVVCEVRKTRSNSILELKSTFTSNGRNNFPTVQCLY